MDKNLISNVLWATTGQVGYILVGLVGTIVLGRLLSPQDFGVVGIAMFFVGISNVLVESGMGGALVRKPNTTEVDYSTIFIFNLLVSLFLCLSLIVSAPFIADFYELDSLKNVLVVLSSILIINAFTITQNAKLVKEMQFKKRGFYKFISLFFAVLISVIIAYFSRGVWAIVAMQLLSALFLMLIFWLREGGVGGLVFSKESFNEMSSFGLFTTLSSILIAIFDNIYQLVIGKYFSVSQVGFYYQAKKLQEAPDTVYKLIILQVVYAHLSKYQNKLQEFKIHYNMIAKFSVIILGLTTALTYIYAKQIVLIILGEKWLNSVFFLQILVLAGFFNLQEIINRNIFKIFDQTHKIFYIEILKKIIQTFTIIIGILFRNLEILLFGFVITSIISYFINFYYSRKIVDDISRKEIIIFLKVVFIGCITSFITIYLMRFFDSFVSLILIPLFLLLYFSFLHFLKVQSFTLDYNKIIKTLKN